MTRSTCINDITLTCAGTIDWCFLGVPAWADQKDIGDGNEC